MQISIALILVAALWRMLLPYGQEHYSFLLWNFAPVMAITFCGALYLPRRQAYLIPLGVMLLTDAILNLHHGFPLITAYILPTTLAYLLGCGLGQTVARHKNWGLIFGGTIASSLVFYVLTNTTSWLGNPAYAQTFSGWWQSQSGGLPGFPPSYLFLRNSLVSDLLFTTVFVLVAESRLAVSPLLPWNRNKTAAA